MAQSLGLALTSPPPPGLQEATKNSTQAWQEHLEALFRLAKDRFPDVVWELVGEEDEPNQSTEEVWGHKAIVYARAPPSFQTRYFAARPHGATSPLPYSSSPSDGHFLADSTVSLPNPERSGSPSTIAPPSVAPPTLLRLTTSINPTLFSNELEYLYTGKGFGEAFEFLFDESREHLGEDAEALRIDKLRKDLVFMWRSRLYSDVRIALTGAFGGSHENTTAIFSSHRFILVSRSSYFHDALISWNNKSSAPSSSSTDPPTLTLPSPPFTPASLHFTLGFIYTGTLIFSHRSYDLSTAFAILRAALYLALPTLHDEVQARVAQEMMHGLFHAFIPFAEYDRLTASRWGTGGCRCRQCARRAPRVLEFAIADDVKNTLLERGARRALVGLFGEGWCNSEFASLHQKLRESVLKGVAKRTTPQNAFPLLFAAEHALVKLSNQIEPWADIVRDMLYTARKGIDEVLADKAEQCFNEDEWLEIMENDGVRFEDGERVEWAMAAVLRGVKVSSAPSLYQTLVSSILLRPHPTEVNAPLLAATSHIRVQVEQTRVELLKWIGKRWLAIRQERGFDNLEGWAATEISDHIEVALDDLFNPSGHGKPGPNANTSTRRNQNSTHLRPHSNHPHTSRVDVDSEAGSSMRASVLTRSAAVRGQQSSTSMRSPVREDRGRLNSSATSVHSIARSTASRDTVSTISATPRGGRRLANESTTTTTRMSPAKRLANEVRAKDKGLERPDSKLTPSIIEPDRDSYVDEGQSQLDYDDEGYAESQHGDVDRESRYEQDEGQEEHESYPDEEEPEVGEHSVEGGEDEGSERFEDTKESMESGSVRSSLASQVDTPVKKVLITRQSLNSLKSTSTSPNARLKPSSSSVKTQSTSRSSVRSPTLGGPGMSPRPNSRGSTRSSRLNVSVTGSGPRARQVSRPISRLSTASTSVSGSTNTGSSSRPTSSISSTTTDTVSTFRTASTGAGLSTPTMSRSRRPSAASSIRTTGRSSAGSSPVQERARTISGASVSSVASTTVSIKSTATAGARKKKAINSATPSTSGAASKTSPRQIQASSSARSAASAGSNKKPVPVGTLGRKLTEKKSTESLASKAKEPVTEEPPPPVPNLPSEGRAVAKTKSEKENTLPAVDFDSHPENTASTITIKPRVPLDLDHKKTSSSASTSSVATLKKRGSADTIKTVKSSTPSSVAETGRPVSKALPPPPPSESTRSPLATQSQLPPAEPISIDSVLISSAPRGATLDVGIPCIISSKRKRFKALARYIGEVEGESGPWVGVEVPMPLGDSWGDNDDMSRFADDRQWNDGSWGGIRYFDIGSMGSEIDYGDDRPSRRRRLDGSGVTFGSTYGRSDTKGSLKREGDQLSVSSDRMKRMRSVSPSVSEMSGTESRGLFVRPQQVLYVVDAIGVDL